MLEAIDYLTTGYLPPINNSNTPNRLASLKNLWDLCIFAMTLDIPDLEDACVTRIIDGAHALSLATWVEFANFCCDGEKSGGVKLTSGSKMGKWIVAKLADNLRELDQGGWIDSIKKRKGTLKEFLIDVIVERLRMKQE